MRDRSMRQVVVLGEPGAGKSTLALLYVLAANSSSEPDPDQPVPVPFQLGGWHPRSAGGLDDWLVERIREDYPHLVPQDVVWLVRHRKVVAVLDGLDELPANLRGEALVQLETAAAGGLRMVVTCRSAEFEETAAAVGVLPQAVVIEIEPIDVDDAAVYLSQREAVASARWDEVIERMCGEQDGPLAGALSTPLMISLARQVYRAPSTDPGELTGLPSPAAVRDRLLDRFLPAVYGNERAGQVRRWLVQLIGRLPATPYDPNLAWWRLGATVPRPVIVALITCAVTVVGLPLGNPISGTDFEFDSIALWGLLGLVAGLRAARIARATAQPAPPSSRLVAVRRELTGLASPVAAASLLVALLLLLLFVVARSFAVYSAVVMVDVLRDPMSLRGAGHGAILPGLLIALVILTIVFGIGAGRAGTPRRTAPQLRALPRHLFAGLGWGALVGSPGVAMGALHAFDLSTSDGVIITMIAAALTGVPLGVGRWLSSPVTVQHASTSPIEVLRRDRTALLLTVAGVTIAVVVAAGLTGLAFGVTTYDVEFTVPVATAVAVLIFFGSGSAWLSYSVARLWLAATRRLPWRLAGFLRDAERRGVLRRAGDTYQIRHDLLRNHLAGEAGPARAPAPTGRSAWRRRLATSATVVAVAAAPAVAFGVDARPTPVATLGRLPLASSPRFDVAADGRTILAVTDDGTARLWNAETGHQIAVLDRVSGWDRGWETATFDADGRTVLTVQDGTGVARLWDAATGARIATLGATRGGVGDSDATYNPAGSTVLTVGSDRIARLWRTRDGALEAVFEPCRDAQFSPDGRTVFTVADDGTVRLWNAATGALIAAAGRMSSPGSNDDADDVRFSPDGRSLLTFDADAKLARLWNAATGTPVGALEHVEPLLNVEFSPNGAAALVEHIDAGGTPAIRVWDLRTGRSTSTPDDFGALSWVKFTSDDTMLGQAVVDGRIGLWTTAGRLIATLTGAPGTDYGPSVTLDPNGDTFLSYGDGYDTRLVEVHTGRIRYAVDQVAAEAEFSPDGRLLVTVERNGRIRVVDVDSGQVLATARHSDYTFDFSPDGATLAITGSDAMMTLRRLPDYQTVATLDRIDYGIAAFTPDGRRVVTVDWTGKLRLWTVPQHAAARR